MARRPAGPRVSFRAAPVQVRVPATSANLGPGFDAFGLALGLHDHVVVRIAEEGLRVDVAGEGAEAVRRDDKHLVVRALRATFDLVGGQPRGLELVCANRIPHGRGLGSSAAAIVAGVLAARALVLGGEEALPDDAVLALATELEGHPDNVAACLRGGFTIAWTCDEGAPGVAALAAHPDLSPVAFVPSTTASTAKVRRLLPETVPHADAAANAARAGLLSIALTSRPDLLMTATEDRLHQRYRAPAMPRSLTLVDKLRAAGVPAVLSGAGPTVLALTTAATVAQAVGMAGAAFDPQPLPIDDTGAVLVPLP